MLITYPRACRAKQDENIINLSRQNLSASVPSEVNSGLSQNSGQNPVENCGGGHCRVRPELRVRTCGGIHERAGARKRPKQ